MDTLLLAITISFSIIGLLILLLVLLSAIFLCQATISKDQPSNNNNDEANSGCCATRKYDIRTYLGCFPRCKGPQKVCMEKSDCKLRSCWFQLFCCCQDVSGGNNLDTVFSSTVVLSTASNNAPSRPASVSQKVQSLGRPSLLAMEPIILPGNRYSSAELQTIPEAVDCMDFYAHQIETTAEDRMMY